MIAIYDLLEATIQQIQLGGWVMYPLIITSLWMWYLIGEKIIDMYNLTKGDRLAQAIMNDLARGKKTIEAALWQRKIVDGYLKERTKSRDLNENIIESLRINQEGYIVKHVGTISLLATIAPLFGLLGTVSGMIKTFSAIAEFGTGNARALAAGISEALITTQTGLIIAVPGLFLASFLIRRSDELIERMRRFCLRLNATQINVT